MIAPRAAVLAALVATACVATPAPTVPPLTPAAPTPAPAPSLASPSDAPKRAVTAPLVCAERVAIPTIAHVVEAAFAPDGVTLAVSYIATLPSKRTVTGNEEEMLLDALDLRTGAVRPLGAGERPQWSGSGAYLSYWNWLADLYVLHGTRIEAAPKATLPEARWVGDELLYIFKDEIHRWSAGGDRVVARLPFELTYPQDDVAWSGDGERFTLTRYPFPFDGTTQRFVGATSTGALAPLDAPGATFTEWSPSPSEHAPLLVRYADRLELRGQRIVSAPLASFPGAVHAWAPDGLALLVGALTPPEPGGDALDVFNVFGAQQAAPTATLPNLFGMRRFSPSGEYFMGTSRTSLYGMRLELYRCGAPRDATRTTPPDLGLARQIIVTDPRHFVRPAAGSITQFLQGRHTGIDVAAPLGSLIVAADAGVVGPVDFVAIGGRRVCIEHGALLESCYYHVSAALVRTGERVLRDQPIALIGLTGDTTGPHVHWEVQQAGRILDPLSR